MQRRVLDCLLPLILFALPLVGAPGRLAHPAPWIGIIAAYVILFSQPALTPREMVKATREDRLSALGIYLGMILPQVVAVIHYGYREAWTPLPFGWPVLLGAACVAAGLTLRLTAIRTLGRFFTSTVMVQDGQRVVRSGPYRLLRHPSYTGAMLGAAGVATALGSVWGLALVPLLAIPAYAHRIRSEEKAMVAGLGEEYRRYQKDSWRLVPYIY